MHQCNPFLGGQGIALMTSPNLLGGYTIMPKDLTTLVVRAIDEFEQLAKLEELLNICFEQLQEHSDKTQIRIEFLLELCLPYANLHFGEMKLPWSEFSKL